MGLNETILFYLLIGAAVSIADLLSHDQIGGGERLFRTVTALVFWPLYLPFLLRRPVERAEPESAGRPRPEVSDEMAAAIAQVEAELDRALSSLDGWAEDVLAHEQGRFSELRRAWRLQAARIRELDQLLEQPEFLAAATGEPDDDDPGAKGGHATGDRIHHSEQARRENIARLRTVRKRMDDDLMGTLAWVRELVTMIHLAKFTGAPASRAEELVEQIAAAVEGLSEVTAWREEALAGVR